MHIWPRVVPNKTDELQTRPKNLSILSFFRVELWECSALPLNCSVYCTSCLNVCITSLLTPRPYHNGTGNSWRVSSLPKTAVRNVSANKLQANCAEVSVCLSVCPNLRHSTKLRAILQHKISYQSLEQDGRTDRRHSLNYPFAEKQTRLQHHSRRHCHTPLLHATATRHWSTLLPHATATRH